MKSAFDLWHLDDCPGIIVPCASGISFTNQVGGTLCGHPEIEGVFIPFPSDVGSDIEESPELLDYYEEEYDRGVVSTFLTDSGLARYFEPLAAGEEFYGVLAEAWVPVRVRSGLIAGRHRWSQLSSLEGRTVIVTCKNSD